MSEHVAKWKAGMRGEPEFWHRYLRNTHAADLNPDRKLRSYFGPMIGRKRRVTIADVGSGPVSMIGYTWPGTWVKLVPMDMLAERYAELLKQLRLKSVIPIVKQDIENIDCPDNTFDIVHCSNALDHCVNPRKAITELVRICKPGGWVYMRHFTNVGKRGNYGGLHQWNIHPTEDGDCLFWDREREKQFLLSQVAAGFNSEVKIDTQPGDVTPWSRNKTNLSRMGVSILYKPI